MDKVQTILEIRRSFDVSGETTKPALLSFKKSDDEKAVFTIDIAFSYKGFRYDQWGVSPFVQFDYSSKTKDQLEKLKGGIDVYYKIYNLQDASAKLVPSISFSKDFYSKIEEFQTSISFIPRFPNLFIPIRNVSDVKFKYDGNDNRWVFGFNPIIGSTYKRTYGGKHHISETDFIASFGGGLALKRYYLQFEIYGKYEEEFDQNFFSRYRYEGTATFYFDEKERSSLNAKFEQEEKNRERKRKITLGFGIKL